MALYIYPNMLGVLIHEFLITGPQVSFSLPFSRSPLCECPTWYISTTTAHAPDSILDGKCKVDPNLVPEGFAVQGGGGSADWQAIHDILLASGDQSSCGLNISNIQYPILQ